MSLNIKNPESVQLAKELAARTGETLTGAITTAIRERLERLRDEDRRRRDEMIDDIMKIARDTAPRWKEPFRSTEHGDLLYDDKGLPR